MRIYFDPSFGRHLLSVNNSEDVFKSEHFGITILRLSTGMFYMDIQQGENFREDLLPYVDNVHHTTYLQFSSGAERPLGEYRYKTASAILTGGTPPKGHILHSFGCDHVTFSGKNPADVRELERRLFLGEIRPHKAVHAQPKTLFESIKLAMSEFEEITFVQKLYIACKLLTERKVMA